MTIKSKWVRILKESVVVSYKLLPGNTLTKCDKIIVQKLVKSASIQTS